MLLDQEALHKEAFSVLSEIQKAAQHSADITRQLLAFARKQTISPRELDLNETVAGMLKMLKRLIGENINLQWLPGSNFAKLKIDPSQINQILANLCVNAKDAITGTGLLTIETGNAKFDEDYCTQHSGYLPGKYVMLAVSDNGCGINELTLPHIFEPFYTTKDADKGTGLGLATVYGIVEQNSGFIIVASESGQGTSFKIYLPQYETSTGFLSENDMDNAVDRGYETILLVEDEPSILAMAKTMLEKLGYRVIPASRPIDAIRLAQDYQKEIHLLITDVVMPGMHGRDLAENLLSKFPSLKILFMSGYTANVIAHHGVIDEGINYIQKPFLQKELSIKVRQSLDGFKKNGRPDRSVTLTLPDQT